MDPTDFEVHIEKIEKTLKRVRENGDLEDPLTLHNLFKLFVSMSGLLHVKTVQNLHIAHQMGSISIDNVDDFLESLDGNNPRQD
jgi:hypothetical protein